MIDYADAADNLRKERRENGQLDRPVIDSYGAPMTTTEIVPGTPATYGIGSDSYPHVVTRVSPSGKTAWVREVDWKERDEDGRVKANNLPGAVIRSVATGGYGCDLEIDVSKCIPFGEEIAVRLAARSHAYGHFSFGRARFYRDPSF